MEVVSKNSILWQYLSDEEKGLILDGELLLSDLDHFPKVSDYSFLVFPFSKAYEGFLKQFFLDLGLIREDEYYGDDIRIGKILNPHFIKENGSVYDKLSSHKKGGKNVTNRLWEIWRKGRNQVFHYFPHNFRRLSKDEAIAIIENIVSVMHEAVAKIGLS